MNFQKEINERIYEGPSLRLRGITEDQINTGHAFLIYLTFKIKHGLRYLQEEVNKTIPAICVIDLDYGEELDESLNFVDYECIGDVNETIPEDSELIGLEGNTINLNSDILVGKDLKKYYSVYNASNIIIFTTINDTLGNRTFSRKTDFSFIGKLNRDNDELVNNANLTIPMNEIEEKTLCYLYKDNQLNANLTCSLEIKNDYNISKLSFNQNDLKIGNTPFFIRKMNSYNISYDQDLDNYDQIIYRKSSSGISGGVIAAIVIASIVVLGGIAAGAVYFFKCRKPKVMNGDNKPFPSQSNEMQNPASYVSQDIMGNY